MNSSTLHPVARPLFFGPDDARLFGWVHAAPAGATPAFGLVVCGSFGFEALHAHLSLCELAKASAAAGVPSLRFDYYGCGNSCSDEYAPDLLGQWVQSVHRAVDELKRQTGVQRVCLLGLRLGSLLASLCALERTDIVGMVAIAPVLQGRQFVREMRALSATGSLQEAIGINGEALVEAGGFFLTSSTAQALSAVDVRSLQVAPAKHILIVQRDDMPPNSRWADALAALGAEVRNETWSGYEAMMADPQRTQVPREMIQHIVLAMQTWQMEGEALPAGQAGAVDSGPALEAANRYQTALIQETPVYFDAGGTRLFGILTVPRNSPGASLPAHPSSKVGVLMVNQGCVHHIGPSRMWVTQARKWASLGLVVLRMDLSGIGGSAARPGLAANLPYSPAALDDIGAGLHYLQSQCEGGGCHLLGLCSGAYHAFQSAVSGRPLLSAVIINPLIYSVAEAQELNTVIKDYELQQISSNYRDKIFSLAPWKKLLAGKVDYRYLWHFLQKRLTTAAVPVMKKIAEKAGVHLSTPLSREVGQAAQSGTVLQFVFAEGDGGVEVLHRNAEGLMGRLKSQNKLSVDFVAPADHTFTTFSAREKLLKILDRRISL